MTGPGSETAPGDGRIFLVTGASGGIGAATARAAAAAGYRLVLAARGGARLSALAKEVGGEERALAVPCDVTDEEQVRQLVERAEAAFGRLDVAFVNAGQSVVTSFLDHSATTAGWREMVLTNVYGVAVTARAALPALVRTRGHLVLTGSVQGRLAAPGSLYSATKWAVTALAQSIRAEAVGTGIRVTLVQPGLTDTASIPEHRHADPKLDPADVARAVLYAVAQPPEVDVSEVVIRPVGQAPNR